MGFLQFAYSVKNIESDRWLDEQSLERKRESFHPTENTVSKLGGGFLTETCSKWKTQTSNRKFFFFFFWVGIYFTLIRDRSFQFLSFGFFYKINSKKLLTFFF